MPSPGRVPLSPPEEKTEKAPERPISPEREQPVSAAPLPPRPAVPRVMSVSREAESEEFDDEDAASIAPELSRPDLDIQQLLGKRKSVEELIGEVKEVPLVQEIVGGFQGRIVDVHEISEEE